MFVEQIRGNVRADVSGATGQELTQALAAEQKKRAPVFLPILETPFASTIKILANRKVPSGTGRR